MVLVDLWLPWAAPFTVLHWQEWKAVERRATKGQGAVRLEVLHLHGKVIQQATPKAAAAAARSRTAYLRSGSHGLGRVRGLQ